MRDAEDFICILLVHKTVKYNAVKWLGLNEQPFEHVATLTSSSRSR